MRVMTEHIRWTWRKTASCLMALSIPLMMLDVGAASAFGAGNDWSNAVSRAYVPWGDARYTQGDNVVHDWPAWMLSAFRNGGDWRTNPAAWHVAAGETNEAALHLEVDRLLLTNDLTFRMGYVDHSNATLYVDLYDTNNAIVATNLLDNLLTGSGADTNRVLVIPLETHANATGIRLRRGSGEITLFDTLLYVDKDADGLDADQERQLGTSDNDADSDQDGFTDYEEAVLFGTDPASAASVPFGSLTGQVSYSGVMTGTIHVVAAPAAGAWTSAWSTVLSAPGFYSVGEAPQRRTYHMKAYRDVNGNGVKDHWEPCGTALPAYLASEVAGGVDVVMGDPDSDGDGMSDAVELALGMDPFVSNAFARLPFVENFESNTVQSGELNGQNGWEAVPEGAALVQTGLVWEGSQALRIDVDEPSARVCQLFGAGTNAPVVWADAYTMAWEGSAPTSPVVNSANAYFGEDGYLRVYDGLAASTNKWLALTNLPPHAMTGEWVRLTVKLDYASQRWLVCMDGVLARGDLGFAVPASEFNMMSIEGKHAVIDGICIGTNQPAGLLADGDHLPDDWELAYFGNLDQVDGGDPDNDGLTNLQEYLLGTSPANADTDQDGMPDGWEVAHGFDPGNAADAIQDADGDGMSNGAEYRRNTDPRNAGDVNITLYVDPVAGNDANYGTMPDGAGLFGPKRTIAAALEAAVTGDRVQAAQGVYTGGLPVWRTRGKTIRLVPRGAVIVK